MENAVAAFLIIALGLEMGVSVFYRLMGLFTS